MKAYLDDFFRERIVPYRTTIEDIPLESRVGIAESIKDTFIANVNAGVAKQRLFLPTTLDEKLKSIYVLTAQLGWDFGRLLSKESGPRLRIGEDYVVVYGEVMTLFGEDKEQARTALLKALKDDILRDKILRYIGIGPQQVLAWFN